MPIILHWEPKGLHIEYSGETNIEDVLSEALALSADSRFDNLTYIIGDYSNSTGIKAQIKDVEKLVAYTKALSRTNPYILNPTVLPDDDDTGRALIAFYVMITENIPWKTTWVHSEVEARKWIADHLP